MTKENQERNTWINATGRRVVLPSYNMEKLGNCVYCGRTVVCLEEKWHEELRESVTMGILCAKCENTLSDDCVKCERRCETYCVCPEFDNQ